MQQTFQLSAAELNTSFIKSVQALYGKKRIKIVIEEMEEIEPFDQRAMFRRSEEIRLSLKKLKVDPNLNLSELANEVNL